MADINLKKLSEESGKTEVELAKTMITLLAVKAKVMGGEPVIRDTRIPTATIVALLVNHDIDELKKLYRRIPPEKIEKAVEYERYLDRQVAVAAV